jgi:hypothetical protein
VHALLSLQTVPLVTAGFEQVPVVGSQRSCVHALPSPQLFGAPPVHTPAWHVSPVVHAFPSLHAVPFAADGCEQVPVPVLHKSCVQTSPSLQSFVVPAVQVPLWHVSLRVHALASLQAVPFATAVLAQLPVVVSHVSVVHELPSLQSLVAPAVHVPP